MVVPFLLCTAAVYVALLISVDNNELYINILGQVSGLLFAVFVGYIAFAEWSQSKFEGLFKSGLQAFKAHDFKAAQVDLDEAHKIKPKHTALLPDLLELYIINDEFEKFDKKIDFYKSIILDDKHLSRYYWLRVCRHLMSEDLKKSKSDIDDAIRFMAKNPHLRKNFKWTLEEIKSTSGYKKLTASAKRMFDNYYEYLEGTLSSEKEAEFVKGHYDIQ